MTEAGLFGQVKDERSPIEIRWHETLARYKATFNATVGIMTLGHFLYTKFFETEEYKKALVQYENEALNTEKILSKEEFEKWEFEHEPPNMPSLARYIPESDTNDVLEKLINESLDKNIDLLWDRYKDNVINILHEIII